MRIVRSGMRAFALPLRVRLATAHGPIDRREGFLVSLEDEAGRIGLGEATPLPEFGTEDRACCQAALEKELAKLADGRARGFDEALRVGSGPTAGAVPTPCARAALDSALHDLEAQRAGRSLAAWLRAQAGLAGTPARRVRVQALVGGEGADEVAARAEDARRAGFAAFKLKLAVTPGQRDPGPDLERVAALREAVGPAARLRLDANEAWSASEAARALAALARFDIDFVEQPVSRGDLTGLAELDAHAAIPIAADEALLGAGLEAVLSARAASIFVLKPSALGGLRAACELWRRAREASIRIVWSSLIDGLVARAGALALAAALGDDEEVHGLGTASLLARDLTAAVPDDVAPGAGGTILLADRPGLGCALAPAWSVEGEAFGASFLYEADR